MIRYLLRRFLLFIPTLFLISAATFFLSKNAPGDPVEVQFQTGFTEADYIREAQRQGLDKPNFYFTWTTQAYPDTFHQVLFPDKKETLEYLIGNYGNWEGANQYFRAIEVFESQVENKLKKTAAQRELLRLTDELYLQKTTTDIREKREAIAKTIQKDTLAKAALTKDFDNINRAFVKMERSADRAKHLIPNFIWHGIDNQFHRWISKFLKGDYGVSLKTGKSVSDRVTDAVFWTVIMNSIAIILAFGIAIPLGVKAAANRNSRFDRNVNFILYALYSLPAFWIGTMLLVFFCTPEYGMKIFPSSGLGQPTGHGSLWRLFTDRAFHLFLPIICITYPALAFIFRQMRASMINELSQNYIRTARAKGLPEQQVIWKHAFRNALFPIITLAANILPALIAGAVTIEVVFNIPGMGKLMVDSIFQSDWPIVYAIMMFGAVLTMTGILLADILYAWLDPRIRY